MILLESFISIINSTLSEPHAGLLSGILFGTKATLDPGFKQSLITTGTLHIIALSGMNISIMTALVNASLLRYMKRPIANIVSIALIIGFIALVGPSPSVIRAAIMGSITLIAVSLGKQVWSLWSWILAVIIMLVLNPLWAIDISFQLSVLATLGIVLFGQSPQIAKRYEAPVPALAIPDSQVGFLRENEAGKPIVHILRWARTMLWNAAKDDLRITLAAQVFTMPLMIFQFQRISFISPLTNILIGWLIGPVTVVGFILVGLGVLWMPLAHAAGWIVWVMLSIIIHAIQMTALIPYASVGW